MRYFILVKNIMIKKKDSYSNTALNMIKNIYKKLLEII